MILFIIIFTLQSLHTSQLIPTYVLKDEKDNFNSQQFSLETFFPEESAYKKENIKKFSSWQIRYQKDNFQDIGTFLTENKLSCYCMIAFQLTKGKNLPVEVTRYIFSFIRPSIYHKILALPLCRSIRLDDEKQTKIYFFVNLLK